ncbi:hypothetical protein [Selenihalanaerobacter shriftii]|uniref:Phage late control gene D protein (GPD) n=1 Tax=Selenihalanaerobacter shriftii TaxID=142842 RepID=A0A1T4Q1S9_9FIRM|nr:hypothetical protein [Selenihalanaerobacter shriftii]SJZ97765.1 Phage late control gene D protein (GPD) [Selenihalanaerobacter shriftii]
MASKSQKEEKVFTPQKVKFDPFEFVSLYKMEIKKSIYDHTRVVIEGAIDEENVAKYERYLAKEDPKLMINHSNQDNKILFKGIIQDYDIIYKRQDYYLTLEAVSYSILLKRVRPNRIYQNLGTTYKQVLDKIMQDNSKFNIVFGDNSQAQTVLTTKNYPMALQYKESEWDFLKRISSYLDQPVIVDDTKDDKESINILIGLHNATAKELNNISGVKRKKTGRKNHKFNYYKVDCHEHFRSKEVYNIGKKVKYRLTNQKDQTIDLIVIKNRIYIEEGVLCSDLTLVKEEDINILQERREIPIEGRSFRAKVMKLNKDHTAQVDFIDIADEYNEAKSFHFPIDRNYTDSYFAPEVDDIVDIYFKSKNEKHATLKSSSTDSAKKIDHKPTDKLIITPGGYKIRLNNGNIFISGKDDKSLVEIKEETMKMKSAKGTVFMTSDEIKVTRKNGDVSLDNSQTKLKFSGKEVQISSGGINMV